MDSQLDKIIHLFVNYTQLGRAAMTDVGDMKKVLEILHCEVK